MQADTESVETSQGWDDFEPGSAALRTSEYSVRGYDSSMTRLRSMRQEFLRLRGKLINEGIEAVQIDVVHKLLSSLSLFLGKSHTCVAD